MNERMVRASPTAAAEFVGAFEEGKLEVQPRKKGVLQGRQKPDASGADPNVWLVWKDEGDFTLWDLMQSVGAASLA